ncbi:hypothetical protein PROFUN_05123 [Planoprotostelium fungivorum]|uniref:Uncharacterized protein n=1 Tax=Planoprotostelium fungivorum TaxID=1890364 RepID=A0A2P6NRQ5_9EUKA|nr:hypothetical protein PROFUN_05123 [Planoprotostelium fungivorum]
MNLWGDYCADKLFPPKHQVEHGRLRDALRGSSMERWNRTFKEERLKKPWPNRASTSTTANQFLTSFVMMLTSSSTEEDEVVLTRILEVECIEKLLLSEKEDQPLLIGGSTYSSIFQCSDAQISYQSLPQIGSPHSPTPDSPIPARSSPNVYTNAIEGVLGRHSQSNIHEETEQKPDAYSQAIDNIVKRGQ